MDWAVVPNGHRWDVYAAFARRVMLADAFNRGYESYSSVHRSCTPAARVTISQFMDEGARLSAEIVARYGDDG